MDFPNSFVSSLRIEAATQKDKTSRQKNSTYHTDGKMEWSQFKYSYDEFVSIFVGNICTPWAEHSLFTGRALNQGCERKSEILEWFGRGNIFFHLCIVVICLQKGLLKLNPQDGNCAGGCQYLNPGSASLLSLTGLLPGQSYEVQVQSETIGLISATLIVTQNLFPGQVEWSQVSTLIDVARFESFCSCLKQLFRFNRKSRKPTFLLIKVDQH